MYDIDLPNGNVLEGVPDGATKEEIKRKAIALGLAVESDFPVQKQEQTVYDPTEGMSAADKFWAGMGKSIHDTYRGAKQLFGMLSPEEIAEYQRLDAPLMDTGWGMAGNIVGHGTQFALPGGLISGTGKAINSAKLVNTGKAMMAPTTYKGATLGGAVYGLLQPGDKVMNTAMGGLGGAGGMGLSNSMSRILSPKTSKPVQELLDADVDLTPGMILGGGAKRFEDSMTSMPILGDVIRKSQSMAVKSLNKSVWNKVLSPIGKKLPDDIHGGHETVDYVYQTLSDYYEDLLPKMSVAADRQFISEMLNLSQLTEVDTLPPETAQQFNKIIQKHIFNRMTDDGLANGQTLKTIESKLGELARGYKGSANSDQKVLGRAVEEAQRVFRGLVERSNPKYHEELKNINKSWAMLARAGKAAESVGGDAGEFSGAQLYSAVKHKTPGRDKVQFRRGKALLQDIATAAKENMGQTVADSGTPLRAANIAGAGAVLGGAMADPTTTAMGLLGIGAYGSKTGQDALRTILTSRPDLMRQLGGLLRNNPQYGAGLGVGGLLATN